MKYIVLAALLGVSALSAHPWACFHGDPQHTGKSAGVVGAPFFRISAYAAGDQISGSPVVRSDGCVLFGARDVKLYCLTADLTSPLWVANLSGYGSNIYFSTPALDDSGNVYITTSRKLVKVDGATGAVLWAWPGHNSLSISHSPVIGQDGKVYFACYSDSLYALNPDSTLAWTRPLGASVNSAPAVGLDGRIYVATTRGTSGNKLWCFEPGGTSPWSFDLADEAEFASPAVGPDSTIYVGAGRYLYAVSHAGTIKWRDSLSAQVQSCPAVANESTLYVVAGARLYCIGTDSVIRWRRSIGGNNYCSPAVDGEGNVIVGSANLANSRLYCIAPDSTVRDSYAIGAEIWSSPAINDNKVYFGTMADSIYLFEGAGAGVAEQPTRIVPAFRAWPNPTNGIARFEPAGHYQARVFDAAGSLVAAVEGDRVDLRGMRRGVYLVRVAGSGEPVKLVLH